ncbi:MAG: hypothetical protein NTY03_15890 [Candidatus Bathyarchaeota archaeon]|nr:hypothetical protein [Candidatus Bathyarchaeota archaeon]
MKALIRLLGPHYLEAIEALEKIAVESPKVCLMNQVLLHADTYTQALDWVYNYFKERGKINYERCGNILAKANDLEGHDFVFVWMLEPTRSFIYELINKIDEALKPIGVLYTISIKK